MAAAWCCTPGTPHLYPIPLVLTQQSPSQLCFGPPWLTFPCCLYNVETRAHLFLQLLNGLTLAWDGKLPSGPLYFFLSPPHFQFALSPRSSWEFTSEPELVSACIPHLDLPPPRLVDSADMCSCVWVELSESHLSSSFAQVWLSANSSSLPLPLCWEQPAEVSLPGEKPLLLGTIWARISLCKFKIKGL
jgi:hypothetical protein